MRFARTGTPAGHPTALHDRGALAASRRTGRLALPVAVGVIAATASLAGCAAPDQDPRGSTPSPSLSSEAAITLPPAGASPDYQLGGAYDPASGVGIVARDRGAEPAAGTYSICYVNGFQTQPGELELWPASTLLRDAAGGVFIDPDWPDEVLLDTSTHGAREEILARVSDWIAGCASAGFDAVEFDNLDSYTRSGGALTFEDNLALASALVETAHEHGLAAGQKNAPDDAAALRERAGFDFAITEECSVFNECDAYTDVYDDRVIAIEYTDALPRPFAEMCADPAAPASMVLRDKPLGSPGDDGYAFELCPPGDPAP